MLRVNGIEEVRLISFLERGQGAAGLMVLPFFVGHALRTEGVGLVGHALRPRQTTGAPTRAAAPPLRSRPRLLRARARARIRIRSRARGV